MENTQIEKNSENENVFSSLREKKDYIDKILADSYILKKITSWGNLTERDYTRYKFRHDTTSLTLYDMNMKFFDGDTFKEVIADCFKISIFNDGVKFESFSDGIPDEEKTELKVYFKVEDKEYSRFFNLSRLLVFCKKFTPRNEFCIYDKADKSEALFFTNEYELDRMQLYILFFTLLYRNDFDTNVTNASSIDPKKLKDINLFFKQNNNTSGMKNYSGKSIEPFKELEGLIGMDSIKQDVTNLANLIMMQENRKKEGLSNVPMSRHLVFTGNPGTGKTTVARIIASIYKNIGVLSKGQMVECDRSSLVAGYVGQTAIKTQQKINEAMGGVLFIDEAYSLIRGDEKDFGIEAIDTLLKAMEDRRNSFVVIVAGYPDLMQKFIHSNPGLESRFNKYIHFPDYTAEELYMIFEKMCEKYEYSVDSNVENAVKNEINRLVSTKNDNFANARTVRNLFEKMVTNQASRLAEVNYNVEDMKKFDVADATFDM